MKISYAVTVCNELDEIKKLIPFLIENKQPQDEIVVLIDLKNGTSDVLEYLGLLEDEIIIVGEQFDGHFGNWKNKLTELCSGEYIFQIDADEMPHQTLIENINDILEMNNVDVVLVPRVNTVEGLTQEHINKWGWVLNESGWVNWPDPQWRIYRNIEEIRWVNKVHEKLSGYKTISNLPSSPTLALHHPKTIKKQEKQNKFYETIK